MAVVASALKLGSMAVPALGPSRLPAGEVGVPMMSDSAVDMCRGDSRPSCCWPLDPRGEDGRRTLPIDLGMTQAWTALGTSTSVRHNAVESSENAAVGSEEVDGRWRRRVMMKAVICTWQDLERSVADSYLSNQIMNRCRRLVGAFVLVVSALLGSGTLPFTLGLTSFRVGVEVVTLWRRRKHVIPKVHERLKLNIDDWINALAVIRAPRLIHNCA